jgi:hypothetical protein
MLQVVCVTAKCVSLCHYFNIRKGDINERIRLKILHFWRHQCMDELKILHSGDINERIKLKLFISAHNHQNY